MDVRLVNHLVSGPDSPDFWTLRTLGTLQTRRLSGLLGLFGLPGLSGLLDFSRLRDPSDVKISDSFSGGYP